MTKSNKLNSTLGSLHMAILEAKGAVQRADGSTYPPAIAAHLQALRGHLVTIHVLLNKADIQASQEIIP